MLIHLNEGRDTLAGAYADAPAIVDHYVEQLFTNTYWMLD
jgi:hypothetical protein